MPTRRRFLASATAAAAALPLVGFGTHPAHAATPEVFATDGVAIGGYDPVAYFRIGDYADGDDAFRVKWMGAVWRFANARNMADFEADPHAFAPKYGGYCAYAVSKGYIATTVPEAWTIHEGRLYLNYSKSVRALWRLNMRGHIEAADANWPGVLTG